MPPPPKKNPSFGFITHFEEKKAQCCISWIGKSLSAWCCIAIWFWTEISTMFLLPSNAHISTPFFQKIVFFSKICFCSPPLKICGGLLKFEYMWYWSPVYNFNRERALKSYFPPVSNLPPLCQTPTHRRIYLCICFHNSAMPNFDTVL